MSEHWIKVNGVHVHCAMVATGDELELYINGTKVFDGSEIQISPTSVEPESTGPTERQVCTWFQESTIAHHIEEDGHHISKRAMFVAKKAWECALQSKQCDHDFHYFGSQLKRRCNKCNSIEVA